MVASVGPLRSGTFGRCGPSWRSMRSFNSVAFAAVAILAGTALPLQAAINVQLRGLLGTPIRASLASFLVGTALLAIFAVFGRAPMPGLADIGRAPLWVWTGGILGAAFIISSIVVVPRLGSAYTFALVVAGQMIASIAIDRIGLFGTPQTPLSLARLAGAALLVGGVLLIRR